MLENLKELSSVIAVSGNEENLAELIVKKLDVLCDDIKIDNIGNVIAFKKGQDSSKKVMLLSHMDEVGFVITNILDNGLLKFSLVGGIDERILPAKNVTISAKGTSVNGVIGVCPIHLLGKENLRKTLSQDELYIDIGAKNKQDAQRYVRLGDSGVLDSEFTVFGDNRVLSRALDDRCGCAVLLELIREPMYFDTYFVFTVQEEIGCRGAVCAAEEIKPNYAIVIDSTTACDIYGVSDEDSVCKLNGGGVVSFMDKGTIYNKDFFNLILKTAKEKNINCQTKNKVAGGNDASAVHKSAGGVKTAAISLPCRYLHTPSCVISLSDLIDTKNLVSAVLEKINEL